jgi:hypothetical protein
VDGFQLRSASGRRFGHVSASKVASEGRSDGLTSVVVGVLEGVRRGALQHGEQRDRCDNGC